MVVREREDGRKSDFWTDFGIFWRISGRKMVEIRAVRGDLLPIINSAHKYVQSAYLPRGSWKQALTR
jgi:hypothetical protein